MGFNSKFSNITQHLFKHFSNDKNSVKKNWINNPNKNGDKITLYLSILLPFYLMV